MTQGGGSVGGCVFTLDWGIHLRTGNFTRVGLVVSFLGKIFPREKDEVFRFSFSDWERFRPLLGDSLPGGTTVLLPLYYKVKE